ncbi:uncharacterized protein BDZ83DRAFT_656292 [Colletotrichum acutatum]|uniref:Uncharacterized protein n=1 Tax=Glomerella acutata TaxID=27357 RepID=A0AAD8UDA6_GLOAC|nr:uncharacterized protein BDZ83DRAFT_656292 [Colletotrichum acutatum]KAK1713389.1 hypothetical protein BDZ83DRAFT_656292 [Colletotrichum acutatum]
MRLNASLVVALVAVVVVVLVIVLVAVIVVVLVAVVLVVLVVVLVIVVVVLVTVLAAAYSAALHTSLAAIFSAVHVTFLTARVVVLLMAKSSRSSQTQRAGISVAEDTAIFGLDDSLSTHQKRLQAATAFATLRGGIERNKTLLSTLTKRNAQRRRRDYFETNAKELVQSGDVSQILSPLVKLCSSHPERPIDWLLLALYSLTETCITNIKEQDLFDVFVELFPRAIGECSIFQETREMFIDVLRGICRQDTSIIAQMVAGGAVFQFVAARGDKLEGVLPGTSPFLQGIHTGRQWCWERQKDAESLSSDEMRTGAICAMIPDNDQADISFVLTVGYKAGWDIVQYLEFRSSEMER